MAPILSAPATIDDVCDYVVSRCMAATVPLNFLKLQKLLYYVQAWSLAMDRGPAFDGKFQAWVHGPVNRQVYDRFAGKKMLYSAVTPEDVRPDFRPESLNPELKTHIDSVLDVYARYSGTDLEQMTHREDPWIAARGGVPELERCETEIDEGLMTSYYAARLR